MLFKKIKEIDAFTLVELLCVVALLGLIVMVSTPAFKSLSQRRNLEIAARTMATEMRKAQQRAITAGCGQIIEFYSVTNYRIIDGKTEEKYDLELPEGIMRMSINFPLNDHKVHYLRFNYNGSPSRGGTVNLGNSSGDNLYVIVTPATGRVRISENPPENWEIEP